MRRLFAIFLTHISICIKKNKNTTVHYFSFPKYVSRLKNFREFDFTKKIALMNPIKALL